jgi:hypothetical protein
VVAALKEKLEHVEFDLDSITVRVAVSDLYKFGITISCGTSPYFRGKQKQLLRESVIVGSLGGFVLVARGPIPTARRAIYEVPNVFLVVTL